MHLPIHVKSMLLGYVFSQVVILGRSKEFPIVIFPGQQIQWFRAHPAEGQAIMSAPQMEIVPMVVVPGGGGTLDGGHSYVMVGCDDSRTLFVTGHLFKTSLHGQLCHPRYALDGGALQMPANTFTTSADGTGDFALSVEGIAAGSHRIMFIVGSGGVPYFQDSASVNGTGLSFTC